MRTGSQDIQPHAQAPPRLLFKLLNPLMRALLRSPLHHLVSARLLLLTVTGRRTGKRYTIPLGYAQVGRTLYSGTEGRWATNLRGGAPVTVTLKGDRLPASAAVIADVDGMAAAYRAIHAASPGYARALARSTGISFGAGGEVPRDEVARAQAASHVVIRTTLTEP